jgi:DNA polymerase zeta
MLPDPHKDAVQLIFWCLQTEDQHVKSNGYQDGYQIGVIALNDFDIQKVGLSNTSK